MARYAVPGMVFAAIAICGCAETRTEREFGDSVRHVMSKQVYDPGAGARAGAEPVNGADPALLEGVLEAYRGEVAEASGVSKPVNVEVGGTR